jgi:signal transduction histidine kinase
MSSTIPLDSAQDNRQAIQHLVRLVEVSVTLNSTLNPDDLLQYIIKTAGEVIDCEAASILLYDEKRNRLSFAASTGSDPKKLAQLPVPIDGSLAGTIFRENRSILLNDVKQDPRHYTGIGQQLHFETRSLLGVPMSIRDKGVGVLEALNKRSGQFTPGDERLLSVLASQAAVAIHNARLVQALQKAYDDLSETDRLKSNFLALASHELRTPLGIIIGYASFLQEGSKGEMSEHAERVLNAATQMRSLIEAMTSLHLLQAKGLTFKPRVVPIQQVLHAAYEEIRPLAEEKHHVVEFNLPPQSLLVTADPEKLMPSFVNVLNNAVKFTDPGGSIIVGAKLQGGNILAWIQDNGVGIPPEELPKIFQEFYQVEHHMTRKHGGLGIGLTIARGLVESQGGRIWAESDGMGKGATFKVLLPPAGTSSLSMPTT